MKNLSEYILDIPIDIFEGILDDIDTTISTNDKCIDDMQFTKWSEKSKNKAYWRKTKKGYVIQGDFKLNDIDTNKYHGPKIKNVIGNISISGSKLTSLEGIFDIDCEISGTFTIEDNSELVSLKGCPMQCNTLIVSGNKKLKSIDSAPHVMLNAYFSKNGKKFDKEQLRSEINVYKNIFCSVDDKSNTHSVNEQETIITEAFKSPHMKMLMDKLKPLLDNSNGVVDINYIFGRYVKWDQLDASAISEYDGKDPKAITVAKKFISNSGRGFIMLMDNNGDIYSIIHGHSVLFLNNKLYSKIRKYSCNFIEFSTKMIQTNISMADTVIIVDLSTVESTNKLRTKRMNDKTGAIALKRGQEVDKEKIDAGDIRYYKEIAIENRKRYEKKLIELKTHRAVSMGNFTKLKSDIDNLFQRYTAVLDKILKNPSKYSTHTVDWLHNKFSYSRIKNNNNVQYAYTVETGLLPSLEEYLKTIISASSTNPNKYTSSANIEDTIKRLEEVIKTNIKSVDDVLKEIERK